MSRSYDILNDFGLSGYSPDPAATPDSLSVTAHAIMVIWRYRHPITYSRSKGTSFSKNPIDSIRLRDRSLIIVEDIQSLQVVTSKGNHVGQMNATLFPGANYITEVFPGDWVAAWMVNSAEKAKSLFERLQNGEACNKFLDGLKFMGRMTSIRTRIVQRPDGVRTTNYTMNAASFTEFDASIYYEPYFASQAVGIASEWLQKTGSKINELIKKDSKGGNASITVNDAIPFFVSAFFGAGVPKNQGFSDGALDQTRGLDDPNVFIVPSEVGKIIGVTEGTKANGAVGWHDVCNILQGVQKYQLGSEASPTEDGSKAGFVFNPDGLNWSSPAPINKDTRRLRCPQDMLGTFLPSPPQFNGQRTVWAIMQQYLNPAVNEMYCTLRAGPTGDVMPTLVVRQLPFTSGILDETYRPKTPKVANRSVKKDKGVQDFSDFEVDLTDNLVTQPRTLALTRFTELPRWQLHPLLIKSVDLGRSDALRFNFVHIYGETGLAAQDRTAYIVRDPPIADDMDIIRSGLRPYMATVNCSPQDATMRKAGDWMYIISDIVMGQHLTLTGTVELVGVQSPICPGDNVELDGHILHIETVSHSFNASGTGAFTFSTSLALSHGVKAEQAAGGDFSLYSGTSVDDLMAGHGTESRDYTVNPERPNSPPVVGTETPIKASVKVDPNHAFGATTDPNAKR